jgi:hypothetical protein
VLAAIAEVAVRCFPTQSPQIVPGAGDELGPQKAGVRASAIFARHFVGRKRGHNIFIASADAMLVVWRSVAAKELIGRFASAYGGACSEFVLKNFRHRQRSAGERFARVVPSVAIEELDELHSALVAAAHALEFSFAFISGLRGLVGHWIVRSR